VQSLYSFSSTRLLSKLSWRVLGSVAVTVVAMHVMAVAWLQGLDARDQKNIEPAQVTVELVAQQSLALPAQTAAEVPPANAPTPPTPPTPVEPEPEREPEPEPEPKPELELDPDPSQALERSLDTQPNVEPTPEPESAAQPKSAVMSESASEVERASDVLSAPTQGSTEAAQGLDNPVPPYPPEAYFDRLSGTVILRVRVNADGQVDELRVKQSSGHDILDDSAQSTVIDWQFKAAKQNGVEVAEWVEVPITFQLQ